jgi:hypothetical protein
MLETKAHTIWLDNFSKIRAMQIPDLDIGSWQDCNWTGRAYRVSRVDVDTSARLNAALEIEPAMPNNIWSFMPALKDNFLLHNVPQADCPRLYDTSLTTRMGVNNVPLKPRESKCAKEEHKKAVNEGHDGLTTCFPDGIILINIGSNKGLLRLLRFHYQSICVHDNAARYSALNVDANIFDRCLKVDLFPHNHDVTLFVHTPTHLPSNQRFIPAFDHQLTTANTQFGF